MESSTAVERREPAAVGQPARTGFDEDQKELIRTTIAPDLTGPEFDLFIELAARFELNPLSGEIYAAKMPGKNGEPGKMVPIVGRDGHLAIAQRYPDFRGIKADVVRENDDFEVEHRDGTDSPRIVHRHAKPPKDEAPAGESDEAAQARQRGRIVGAWAKAYREGRHVAYFYAPWGEYDSGKRAWRTNPSAMIRKVAVANALREQFSLSGLYFEGELDRARASGPEAEAEAEPEWGDDPALAARLRQLVDARNAAEPGAYRPAKLRSILATASDDERRSLVETLERELEGAGVEVPEEALEAEAVEEAEEPGVTEAEVVPDLPDDERFALESELADIDDALEQGDGDDEGLRARRAEVATRLGL